MNSLHLLGLIWFMVFNTTSTIFHLYRSGQFYWWRKPKHPEKTNDLLGQWQTLSHKCCIAYTFPLTGF